MTIEDYMTPAEAVERYAEYGVTLDKIRNRLKPSKLSQQQLDEWVAAGLLRRSANTWILTTAWMDMQFKK